MDWFKGLVPGAEEPKVPEVMEEMPAPELPKDFVMSSERETASLKIVKAGKYDDALQEAKETTLDVHDFHEGLVVGMQRPIVAPAGSPPPPHGPGAHRNYQASVTHKYTISSSERGKGSNAQIGVQASFKPDNSDVAIWNYNTESGHSGILARSFGNADLVAQWMQTPYGSTALYANADLKSQSSVTSLMFIRSQAFSVSHMQALWRGLRIGVKAKWDAQARRSGLSFAGKWSSPRNDHIWSGEVEESGAFKLGCVKKMDGAADTSLCAVFEYAPKEQGSESGMVVGFQREYTGGLKTRIAVSSRLIVKTVLEAMVGPTMKATFSALYDPQKRALKHGIMIEAN